VYPWFYASKISFYRRINLANFWFMGIIMATKIYQGTKQKRRPYGTAL
jgi:hypothetical protein